MKITGNFMQNKYFRLLSYPFLLIIPVILFLTSLDTIQSRNKSWYAGGYDPEYAYLFNSLNMATFKLAGHIDHPGTTMQVAGGIVLKVAWNLDPRGEDMATAVLSDPEHYIRILNIATAVIGSLALLLLGWFLTYATGILWIGIILQLTPFISGFLLFNGFTRVTQEVMQMSAAFAMAAMALHWYFNENRDAKTNYTLWFAIIAGFGLASKIIFFPLLIIPFILVKGWKKKVVFILLSILFFVVFTLPVVKMYPAMYKWIYNLFVHSGQYGSGSEGVIDSSKYVGELFNLFKVNPYLFGVFLLSIAVALVFPFIRIVKKHCPDPPAVQLLLAVIAAEAFGYLLIAKQPKAAYLLPYESVAAVNVILILHLGLSLIRGRSLRYWIFGLITLVLAFAGIKSGIARKEQLYGTDFNWEFEEAWGAATGSNQKQAVVFTNPGASPMAGLFFGNAYSHNRYLSRLQNIYPDYYILDAYNNRIIHWGGDPITTDELFRKYSGNLLILHTPGWVEPDAGLLDLSAATGWKMTEVYSGRAKLLAPVSIVSDSAVAFRKIIYNGAETPNRYQTEIRTLSNTRLGDAGILSYDHAHTGLSCVMTNVEKPYAFGIEENGVKQGEKFSVGVWVLGELKDVVLVGSGTESGEFYISSNALIAEEKESGWKKIALEFMVDKEITGGIIKVYVWNNSKEPVFFDDFRCDRISPVNNDNEHND
ncbi:MAG: hypothetical protein IPH20_01460 [Bacteroidales bacterium]|nr:hypothetical protein [Bacteroidales bacterium]